MRGVQSVVWRYYAYRISLSNGFYIPVGIAYLNHQGFGLDVIGLTQAVFAFTLVAAEIPTGYIGDRIGRRRSLVISSATTTVVMGLYAVVHSATGYVIIYALWGVGSTFESGTGDAWLYELLGNRGDESTYARVRGRGSTMTLVASALAAASTGLLLPIGWSLPFLANAALSALGIVVLLTLPKVTADTDDMDPFSLGDALQLLRLQISRPSIRWLVVYVALFYGLFDVTRAFEQPALTSVGVPVTVLGVLYAGFKLMSAGAAAVAGQVEDRLGTRRVFFALIPVIGLLYGSTALFSPFVIPVIVLVRTLGSLTLPIRNQYLNDRLGNVGRATALSGVSMVLSLAGGLGNIVAGQIAAVTGVVPFLFGAGVVVAALASMVWVFASPIRPAGV
jgi:MFS family permease